MNDLTPISVCTDEISGICEEIKLLRDKKKDLDALRHSIYFTENAIANSQLMLKKNKDTQERVPPVTEEEKKAIETELLKAKADLSSLRVFDIKRKKELKERINTLSRRFTNANIYLSAVRDIKTYEESISTYGERLPSLISSFDSLKGEIVAKEKAIDDRTSAVISSIGESEKRIRAVAEAVTVSPDLIPNPLLKILISIPESPIVKGLDIDKSVKLLWSEDIPIIFGGMEWNVLEIQKDRARLLLRETVYDGIGFSSIKDSSWSKSFGRAKLNGEFLQKFTEDERALLIPNEKLYGDKVTILSKDDVEYYLNHSQRDSNNQWWTSSLSYCQYDDECPWKVYYWDSFFNVEYRSSLGNGPMEISSPDSAWGRDHRIGYRPAVWIRLRDDSSDKLWTDFWKTAEAQSINCKGKWTSIIHQRPYFSMSVSDLQRALSGGSAPQRNPRDNFNPNGTPSGNGGKF